MGTIFLIIQYIILSIILIRMIYYFINAVSKEDSFSYLGSLVNLLLIAFVIAIISIVRTTSLLLQMLFILLELAGCIYFGFIYVKSKEARFDSEFDLEFAESFLEEYEIDVSSFTEKSYEEQLKIITSAYVVNCDSGMAEYMVNKESEDDLQDVLDILQPLLNYQK